MKSRYKVLQLQPDYNVKANDFADLGEQIVKALPKARFEVTSGFLSGRPAQGEPVSVASHSHYFELPESALKGVRLKAMWRIYRYCREQQFDVVICNRFKSVNMMLQLNRWLKIPLCIGISHGFGEYDRGYRRRQTQRWVSPAWRFVGVSPAVREYLVGLRCGFTESNTVAITNAIDIVQAEGLQHPRLRARELLGLPADARLVGALGRLVPIKGHVHLLQAFAGLKDDYPQAQVAIIGAGREEANLRREIERLELTGRAHLVGFREDALQYVRAFDIWTMPSLNEGLGLALLEGMSGHLPIIASNVPAMLPLIQGAGGLSHEPGNVEQLKAALGAYLTLDDDALRAKGEEAFRYLQREHDIEEFRQHYLDLIESGLSQSGN
ncbi:glycosyltransferase [Pseudomonas agarici]|uniref:Glycosyltransferase n=1 Tax=Pseudomonas agarici TaxID=46677 RepID=A0A0X1T5P0_PSEAA|nr:glycosyltransferase family 4 protein [Pseudomonas agarici]AMB87424.1 glycosyltransferase [Pseudomonas agarici]NWB90897.1 glycosyltransferase family 4 protein [Pseudomonas agarici]NWC11509.1 glycosyltransferase family 4 protein [Pseudomonas agarici]SEK96946.1 Glycosyltransferase involved in cell wall bisynthesis [Pseudomonas agarici]